MKHRNLWLGLAAFVLLIGGYALHAALRPGPPVQVVKVTAGEILSYVEERARTTLPRIARLTMPFDCRVEAITVEPGTRVAAGEVLARLVSDDLQAALEVAQAELAQVDAELAVLTDNRLEETALQELLDWIAAVGTLEQSAQALIAANQAHLDFALWWTEAEETLRKQGAVAEEKYRRAKTESSEAEVDLAVSELNHQMITVVQQIFELGPKYVQDYLARKQLQAAVLEQQRAAAQARVGEAQRRLARAQIIAPLAGVVLERLIESERVLPAGTLLLTLGDPDGLRVQVDLLSDDAGLVRPGDRVDIHGPALGDLTLAGHVTRVDPQGFTKVSSLGVEQQRVSVKVAFDDGELDKLAATGRHLGIDYRVHARVYIDSRQDALSVPRLALLRASGKWPSGGEGVGWALYRVVGGKALLTPVTLGIGNDQQVQVTRGVQAGDRVIVSPPRDLTDGIRITPEEVIPRA
ncbi:HlyD family efflux transporter periplasmic adaptor subunit [Thiohalocapsa marina]|uniref:HlyD family efflux transporter periplasmic adaptor subunit n=1 Tax=Thiohalocapsa marina TaxID=424902 RepID=A0A5M8FSX9_9GAMM|nr:HlyD family efflux transporter periplasmic adaptor subunit [Thiohalocapsa marina]KAA6186342.1 HlyD family efflux transporter periplasmic adaptor subunit [Thiohalocapsa marina]